MAAPSTYVQERFGIMFYIQLALVILSATAARLCISMWGHSGEGKPPMHGDFEAQRHWMEITVNLPIDQWYVNTRDNDLQYWGLDYPPLTAYHMMLNGKVAQHIYPQMVALRSSKGIETQEVKVFMRLSVLLMDLLIFLPAAFIFFKWLDGNESSLLIGVILMISYPGLMLIDNGHFQYNNTSLGLVVLAVAALLQGFDLVASIVFCMALNYKQMELYHALPFFAYLFGRCLRLDLFHGILKLVSLGVVVIGTFAIIWIPFLKSVDSTLAVLQRLFPVNRGLYEDKVANFWCSISVLIKFKDIITQSDMAFVCLFTTALAVLPSFFHLVKYPSRRNFLYSLIVTSMMFFLFSFHVHEKSILLVAIPVMLVYRSDAFVVVWFLLISVFSMLPLLVKDKLLIPTISTMGLFWMVVSMHIKPTENIKYSLILLFHLSIFGAVVLSIAFLTVPPPSRYPDLFDLFIAIYSCGHFILAVGYFYLKQFSKEPNIYNAKVTQKKSKLSDSDDSDVTNVSNKNYDLRRRKH